MEWRGIYENILKLLLLYIEMKIVGKILEEEIHV